MKKNANGFTTRFVSLLLAQKDRVANNRYTLRGRAGNFQQVGEILTSDDYINHIKEGRFLCKREMEK